MTKKPISELIIEHKRRNKRISFDDLPKRLSPEPERTWDLLSDEQKEKLYASMTPENKLWHVMAMDSLGRKPFLSPEETHKLIDEVNKLYD